MSFRSSTGGSEVPSGVLGVSFNQDGQCFSVGLETGIRIYNTDPLQETMRKGSGRRGCGLIRRG